MNTSSFTLSNDPGENLQEAEGDKTAPQFPHEKNTSDGAEFMDDAIRMSDEPYGDESDVNY